MHAPRFQTHSRKGVTLPEMLVAVALLAVLLVLALPGVSRVVEQSRSAQCVQRQRQVGVLFLGLAADQGGQIRLFRDGTAGGDYRWYNQLRTWGNLTAGGARAAFGCPSYPVETVNDWVCYGMRVAGAPGGVRRYPDDSGPRLYQLNTQQVAEPSKFLLLADSISPAQQRQTFRLTPPGLYEEGGIHLRHRGRANVLFLDGHIEPLDAGGLRAVGISEAIDSQLQTVSTHPGG